MIPPSPTLYSSPSALTYTRWKLRALLLSHLLIVVLLFTLFFPPTKNLWRSFDAAFFKAVNPSLEGPRWWQIFWALASHKWADWFEDLCILSFFITFVRKGHRFVRTRRVAQLIVCTAYSAAIIYFFNRIFIRDHLHFVWSSPSAVIESAVHLSEKVPWLHFKDVSHKCFPGDHATTALVFASFYAYLARGRLALFAGLYGALLCLPRLMTGAHWLSDIVVGTMSIVIFFLSWLFFSPLFEVATNGIEKGMLKIAARFKKQKSYG